MAIVEVVKYDGNPDVFRGIQGFVNIVILRWKRKSEVKSRTEVALQQENA